MWRGNEKTKKDTGAHVTKVQQKAGIIEEKRCLVALYNNILQNAQELV